MKRYIVGGDLGQVKDPTAVVVVERCGKTAATLGQRSPKEDTYRVVDIRKALLGAPYPDIVRDLRDLALELKARAGPQVVNGIDRGCLDVLHVVLDGTGLGRPLGDMVREEFTQHGMAAMVSEIVFTSGLDTSRRGWRYTVPKSDLVCVVDLALQQARLKIAREILLAGELLDELAT